MVGSGAIVFITSVSRQKLDPHVGPTCFSEGIGTSRITWVRGSLCLTNNHLVQSDPLVGNVALRRPIALLYHSIEVSRQSPLSPMPIDFIDRGKTEGRGLDRESSILRVDHHPSTQSQSPLFFCFCGDGHNRGWGNPLFFGSGTITPPTNNQAARF